MNKPFKTVGKIVLIRGGRLILDFDEEITAHLALMDAAEKRRQSTRRALKQGAHKRVLKSGFDVCPYCKKDHLGVSPYCEKYPKP